MIKYFTLSEFEKIEEYSIDEKGSLTTEKPKDPEKAAKESNPDKKSIYPKEVKDKDTGEKKIDKSAIPKDAQVKALAKELFKAQYTALTLQNKIDDALAALTKEDPANPRIAQITATGAIQVANATIRCDKIEAQMAAIGASDKSGNLSITASELASEARNLAMKKGIEEFGEIVYKWRKAAEKAVADKAGSKEEPKK